MEMSEALSRFDALTPLVLGDSFIDEYVTGDCSRLSPEAPVPVLHVDAGQTRRVLGGAANTAANIAALGGKPVLFALYARDDMGQEFEAQCAAAAVTLEPFHDGRPTPRKTRLLGQRQQLLRLDYEETRDVEADVEAHLFAVFQRRLPHADFVVFSDYAKGLLTAELAPRLIRAARAAGKPVIVDPRPQHADRYHGCDYLTPNWKESLGMLGRGELEPTMANVRDVGDTLRRRQESHVLLTLGPKGMAFFHRDSGEFFHLPTAAREVYDVSGAGDTVVAAFALAHAAGMSHRAAVELANRAAGVVVGKLGTATVTREELSQPSSGGGLLVRNQLAPLAALLRAQGKSIVTLNGSFDLLHAGHLHILTEAKNQGDMLIVGLNSDASVRRYKAAGRPLIPQTERARMLLALRCVDYVHIFDEDVPMPFLAAVRPDVHVNGSEYGQDCIEAPTVRRFGGRIHIVEKIPGLSTSALLDRIRNLPVS